MIFNRSIVWTLSVLFLAGCTFNPFSKDNQMTGNPAGTAIGGGAAGGAAIIAGAPKPLVLLSTLGGASLGYYFTTLTFESGGINRIGGQVFSIGDYTTIYIPTDKLFDVNSAELLPNANAILNSVLAVINRFPDKNIMISGNTSGFGVAHFQLKLSEDRARQIAAFLWNNGIAQSVSVEDTRSRKLLYVGYGNYFPIANDLSNDSLRSNSRIQITIYPYYDKLLPGKMARTFSNIGEGDSTEVHLTETEKQLNIANEFSTDVLPQVSQEKEKEAWELQD